MSSHRKCPLVGVSLPLHFSTLRQEKASGGKRSCGGNKALVVPAPPIFSPKALLDKRMLPQFLSHHSCSTRRFFPTTPAPPGVSFPPLLLQRVCFTQLSSHHSCSTCVSFPPLLLHKGLLHTVLFPLLFHMFFLFRHSCFTNTELPLRAKSVHLLWRLSNRQGCT